MKKLKKIVQFSLLILFTLIIKSNVNAQAISPHFFGQNAWMPDTIGSAVYYGKLHKQWGAIQNSSPNLIRFGGIGPDKNRPTDFQYLKMIDSIRAHGAEPIIQVPFNKYAYNATQAADIVKFINITSNRNIKYWSIGNEPDLGYQYTTASQVAAYLKSFSSAMKAIDPSILIMGPECAWFNQNIIDGLTTPNGPDDVTGKDANGRYYLDIISFHTYPFNGTQARAQVISKLTSAGSLNDNLAYLNGRIANCNTAHGRSGTAVLKTAITEANIDYQNDAGDNLYGVGANSFLGGQFWAEMMGVALKNGVDFVNFWSVVEGNTNVLNIGYIDGATNNKKPTYYHFKLMAENFKGNYVNGTSNQAYVKSFGSQSSQQIAVLVMNEDQTNNFNYTVRLNNSAVSGNNPVKININANLGVEYNGTIPAQSTILLVFNSSGALIKKYDYSLNTNAVANLAPTLTNYIATNVNGNEDGNGEVTKDFNINKVYPNPTSAKLNIELNKTNFEQKEYGIEVFSMTGQLVYEKKADFVKGHEEIDLSSASLASAMYVVRVSYDDVLRTEKVMVIR